jgi:hypothetical protein
MPELHILGTIVSGQHFVGQSGYCRYRVVAGPGWTLLDGQVSRDSR